MIETLDAYGSTLTRGKHYHVLDARGPVFGPTYYRQMLANEQNVICYAEGHVNASASPAAKYAFCVAAPTAGQKTLEWGDAFLRRSCAAFDLPNHGVIKGGVGSGNVSRVRAPALLLEPGFLTYRPFLDALLTGEGIDAMGRALAESIRECFPGGGVVGLSVGHMYRGNGDKGAPAPHVEDPAWDQEAEIAEAYLKSAAQFLLSYE